MFIVTTALALLCLVCDASAAIFSRECRQLAASNLDHSGMQLDPTDELCEQHVCGSVPETDIKFYERLSPQCSNLMDQYKSKWSRRGRSNLLTTHPCTSSKQAIGPHGPVIISSEHPIATFAMCTIPKVGCTNFRKLLSMVMMHPEPMPKDSFTQFFSPHMWLYPTVWHYDASNTTCQTNSQAPGCAQSVPGDTTRLPDSVPRRAQAQVPDRLPDSVPSFIVGRNPYIRVLSGFLDKMVHDPLRHDQWTYQSTNEKMGLFRETRWENTIESFHKFVKVLEVKGVADQDEHFAVASLMCSRNFRMDYYLRLEDMEQWFPCWMQGLGLRDFTEYGWADSEDGRMHVGEGEHWITERKSWGTDQERLAAVAAAVAAEIVAADVGADIARDIVSDGAAQWGVNNTIKMSDVADDELVESSSEIREPVIFMNETAKELLASRRKSSSRLVTGDKCWWSPKGMSCEDYYASFTLPDGSVVPSGSIVQHLDRGGAAREERSAVHGGGSFQREKLEQTRGLKKDQHDQNAADRWSEYYDQQTADMIYLLYSEDFRVFGYDRFIVPEHLEKRIS